LPAAKRYGVLHTVTNRRQRQGLKRCALREAIRDLPTSRIGEISALGMGDPAVIPLWYGEGDLPTPDFIGAAATAALAAEHTFYTYKAGLPELRSAIADYQSGLYARPTGAERVVVSSSGMAVLMLVAEALIDPGDNFVIIAPVWPHIAAAVSIMGGDPRLVALDPVPGGGWHLDPARCSIEPRSSNRRRRVSSTPADRPGTGRARLPARRCRARPPRRRRLR
jgi:aspartate/methionine/tyrosine aminotransferase